MSEMEIILAGNPNTGKTTIFNLLTNSDEHVGNFHGVTVEEKKKEFSFEGMSYTLVDLPGIYSLSSLSYEEEVSRDYFFNAKNSKIVGICDKNNIGRNLYLILNLLEYQSEMMVVVNPIDKKSKNKIDYNKLSKALGTEVVEADLKDPKKLKSAVVCSKKAKCPEYVKKLNLSKIKGFLKGFFDDEKLDFFAIKCLEKDEWVIEKLPQSVWEKIEKELPENSIEMVAKLRYDFIEGILRDCTYSTHETYGKSRLDKFVLNPFLSFFIFIFVLFGIFYITFFSVGKWLSSLLIYLLNTLIANPLHSLFFNVFGEGSWGLSLFDNALIGGIGSIFSFLPQVALLFVFLSVLEDTGYMSRVAFMFEDIFGKIGLSGKSVYTLLMGFGCSSTAMLTARNMEDKNAKIKTAILTPYMSCSAKFPIYVVIGGAFFGVNNIFYIVGLYLLGVIISVFLSLFLNKTFLKSKEQSFILEFPPYRVLKIKRLLKILLSNIKSFVIKIGSLLISMNIIVWVLSNFTFGFRFVPTGEKSMLEILGRFVAPILAPLGLNRWGIASSLIAGIIAKEVIVTSIIMFNSSFGGDVSLSLKDPNSPVYFASSGSVVAFLVFSLLYCPCITSIAVLRREIGKKWTIIAVGMQLLIAYLTSFLAFVLFGVIERFGFFKILFVALFVFLILCSVFLVVKRIKKKGICPSSCGDCHKCFPK